MNTDTDTENTTLDPIDEHVDDHADDHDSEMSEKDIVYNVIGCAITVHNEVGPGLSREAYSKALEMELDANETDVVRDEQYPVSYRDVLIDEISPEFVVDDAVQVETRIVDRITEEDRARMYNHLLIAGHNAGVILNFKYPRLQWERLFIDPEEPHKFPSHRPPE